MSADRTSSILPTLVNWEETTCVKSDGVSERPQEHGARRTNDGLRFALTAEGDKDSQQVGASRRFDGFGLSGRQKAMSWNEIGLRWTRGWLAPSSVNIRGAFLHISMV
jgi:hypothetical protein